MSSSDERLVRLLQEARRKLESERKRRNEPIAIVGIGCRFPGGVSNPAAFWRLLASAIDATGEVPADRWNAEDLYDADPAAPGKCYVKRGGFLDAIDGFEPEFFGISPREAVGMDPQQRLLLEVVWEALEDSGISPDGLRGSATGVWIGLSLDDYSTRTVRSGDLSRIDAYSALGTARSVAAGRIAYVLDLHGPVLQVDTSCSSSLVAIHLACQSLRAAECSLAVVGGVSLMASPEATIGLCKLQALAPDGRCKTFDAAADGYGRGEGCGVVVLKPLGDARAAGDRIYATVRGSAVNHDGCSNGLTAPNGVAQEAVLRAALVNAGLEPSSVGYIEAHGTGTLLGDPIEVSALGRVYGVDRALQAPIYLGSVKTNFGHLEGAAGIAGLIKTALCLSHQRIAPHLHFRRPNPKIRWQELAFRVVTEAIDWPRNGLPRAAGVSAFGISGTNAHVLLEEAPVVEIPPPASARSAEVFVLSAKTDAALAAAAERLREHLRVCPDLRLRDVAYSLATTRALMDRRLVVVASTRQTLDSALGSLGRGETPAEGMRGNARGPHGKLAWLFTGQGAQQLGMGRGLYDEWPAFRAALEEGCAALDGHLDRPLRSVMWAAPGTRDAELLHKTAYTQAALFAFGWALAALWRSWGLKPDLVAGHSLGELTAACVAGVFSLADAATLVCARGRLMDALPGHGAMVAIAAAEADVLNALDGCASEVSVAAVNAPLSVVISGNEAAVLAVANGFAARGVDTKRLPVSHGFHSALMEPMLERFRAVAELLAYRVPSLALVSNLSGNLAGPEIASPGYWVRHVRQPVLFSKGVEAMQAEGCTTFLEMGPRATLLPLAAASLPRQTPLLLASARAGMPETEAALHALGGWLVQGGAFDCAGVFPGGGHRIQLPTYPWQRLRYWIERLPQAERSGGHFTDPSPHGAQVATAGSPLDQSASLGASIVAEQVAGLARSQPLSVLNEVVREEVARVLSLPNGAALPNETPLRDLGLDSLMALELRSAFTRRLGATVPPNMVLRDSSVETVVRGLMALAIRFSEAPDIRTGTVAHGEVLNDVEVPRSRLFCFHDAGGSPGIFLPFSELASAGVEVHAVSHLRARPSSQASAEQYLRDVVAYVRKSSPKPFALFGHSLGALLAWRVALEFQALGATLPTLLIVSSAPSPVDMSRSASAEDMAGAFHFVFGASAEGRPNLRSDFEADMLLWAAMPPRVPRPLDVPIEAFWATADRVVPEMQMRRWAECTTRSFSISSLPGPHSYLGEAGPRTILLGAVARRLTTADPNAYFV